VSLTLNLFSQFSKYQEVEYLSETIIETLILLLALCFFIVSYFARWKQVEIRLSKSRLFYEDFL
jgi:hypothetical protein